jgi:hypothetical protein
MNWTTIPILVGLFFWLAFEAAWDLKNRQIPIWFSLVTVVPGLIWLGFTVSPWAAVLMAVSMGMTELPRRSALLGSLGVFVPLTLVIAFFPLLYPLAAGWGILVILWLAGVLGGADALAGTALLLFCPTWKMGAAILAGMFFWSLALLLWKYRRDVGLRLWTVWKAHASGGKQAGIGGYALAVFFYGVYRLIVH